MYVAVSVIFFSDGRVRVNYPNGLMYWDGPTRFVLGIIVEDGYHSAGPAELTVILENLRQPPIITNLDHTQPLPETTDDPTTALYTVSFRDNILSGKMDDYQWICKK